MSFTMLAGKTVLVKSIYQDETIEHYQMRKLVEKWNTEGLSISWKFDIVICSTVKY